MSKLSLLAAASVLALGVAACGGSSSSSSQSTSAAGGGASSTASSSSSAAAPASGGGGGLSIAADPSGQLKFTKSSLTAKAGTVKIDFTNMSPTGHNITIQSGTSGPVIGATPTFMGGSKTLTVKLKPGKYTFFCSVPGHRQAGMQGTLTVS
ncbi:MAG TPA: plastocyanin/azurin family copper-binding protein [Solirubrobacteraceae bacterium]|jgi:plastocyanin